MSYDPNLKPPRANLRAAQNARYTNLAEFMYKVTTVNGRHQYSVAGLERILKGSRILTRDGHVRTERLQRLARSLGVRNAANKSGDPYLPEVFYDDQDMWDYIAEGGS